MRGPGARPLAIHLGPRIALVALNEAHATRWDREDAALAAALFDAAEDVLFHQDVVCEVVLTGLQHGADRARRIPAALDVETVEVRAVRHVVRRVDLGPDPVARLELHQLVGPGADRLHHADGVARAGALERLEDVPGQEAAAREDGAPERLRLLVDDLDGVLVQLVDAGHLLEGAARARDVGGIDGERPVEDHVVGGEGDTVVPHDAFLEPPDDPLAVLGEGAVLDGRDVLREDGGESAVGRRGRQRLVEEAGHRHVAEAAPEVGMQHRRRVPHEDAEIAAAPSLGRHEVGLARLGRRHAGRGEHLSGQGSADAERCHRLDEYAAGHAAALDLLDQLPKDRLVHGQVSSGTQVPTARARRGVRSGRSVDIE